MSFGMRVWDASGRVVLDDVTRIPRVIFTGEVNGSGSMQLLDFQLSRGFVVFVQNSGYGVTSFDWNDNTKTLTWNSPFSSTNFQLRMHVGMYG